MVGGISPGKVVVMRLQLLAITSVRKCLLSPCIGISTTDGLKAAHRLVHDPTLVEHEIDTAANRKEQLKEDFSRWMESKVLGKPRRQMDVEISPLLMLWGAWVYATPNMKHVMDLVHEGAERTTLPADAAADKQVIITEARNDSSPQNADWVELYNAGTEAANLWDWELTTVTQRCLDGRHG